MSNLTHQVLSPRISLSFLIVCILTLSPTSQIIIDTGTLPDEKLAKEFVRKRISKDIPFYEEEWEAYLKDSMNDFTVDEKRCMILRRYMSTLPSTETNSYVINFFSNLFKNQSIPNYRKAAYEVIMNMNNYEDLKEIQVVKGLIPQLYRLKRNYYIQFKNSKFLKQDDIELTGMSDRLKAAQEGLKKTIRRIERKNEKKENCTEEIKAIVNTLDDPNSEVYKKMQELKHMDNMVSSVGDVNTINDINESITLEKLKEMIPDSESSLNRFFEILESKERIEKIYFQLKQFTNTYQDSKLKPIQKAVTRFYPLYEKYDYMIEELNEELEDLREDIEYELKGKLNEVFYTIRDNEYLLKYQELLGLRQEYEDDLKHLVSNMLVYQQDISELELKLGTLSESIVQTFVVSQKDISDMKLEILKMEENNDWMNDLKEETCDANAEEDEEYITRGNNLLFEFRGVISGVLRKKKVEMKKLQVIFDLETQVDETLGKLFGKVYWLKNGLKCFTSSGLSYYFFNMFKTNFIINDSAFYKSFLKTIQPNEARSFMLLNYSIFTNASFVDQIIRKNKIKAVDGLNRTKLEIMIDRFCVKNTLMVNLYKNHINRQIQSHKNNVENGSITSIIFHILTYIHQMYTETMGGNSTSVSMIINVVTNIIWGMVPFINQINFLQVLVNKFLFLFFTVIRTFMGKIFKLGKDKMNTVMNKLGSNMFSGDYSSYTFNLNYEEVFQEQNAQDDEEEVQMQIPVQKIEDLYFDHFNDNSSLVKAEQINLFEPKEFLPKEDEVVVLEPALYDFERDPSDVAEIDILE
jgi:uncharacterized protein (UPF0335 family)